MSVVTLDAQSYAAVRGWLDDGDWIVACLCAGWCHVCEDWRAPFAQLAGRLPQVRFLWVDVEDEADAVDGIEVDDFPTLLIQRGRSAVFLGALRPDARILESVIQSAMRGALPAAALPALQV